MKKAISIIFGAMLMLMLAACGIRNEAVFVLEAMQLPFVNARSSTVLNWPRRHSIGGCSVWQSG